ncbi:MAG: HEAT repeat domain-containing protein [Vulcanococcus sp.]
MTQALSGAAIAAVIAVCWLLGRPRPKLLRSTDASGVAALNRQQMERVVEGVADASTAAVLGTEGPAEVQGEPFLPGEVIPHLPLTSASLWPRNARDRGLLLAQLNAQFRLGGEARRQAMALGAAWGHRAALPLLRRGLRDTDPEVVALAAGAMERFRGSGVAPAQPAARAPRNVSRTR